MREHDVDLDGAVGARSQHEREHRDEHEVPPGREMGHGIEAGRPDALGPGGLLHLQQTAGNSGVSALVAQRSAAHHAGDGHDHDHDDEAGHGGGGAAAGAGQERSPVADVVSSSGRPLDAGVRSSMESALGHDFSDVQVHSDGAAASSAKSVQAQAYTVGNHVVFGEGRYQPETPEGRRTLAHELTHVVQQRQGPVDGTPAAGGIKISDPSDRFEREAESMADRVMSGPASDPAPASGSAPAVQRHEEAAGEEAPVQRQAAPEEESDEEAPVQRQAATEEEREEAPAEAGAESAAPTEAPPSETPAGEAGAAGAPAPEASEATEEAPAGGAPEAAPPAEENEEESVTEQ